MTDHSPKNFRNHCLAHFCMALHFSLANIAKADAPQTIISCVNPSVTIEQRILLWVSNGTMEEASELECKAITSRLNDYSQADTDYEKLTTSDQVFRLSIEKIDRPSNKTDYEHYNLVENRELRNELGRIKNSNRKKLINTLDNYKTVYPRK